MPNTETESVKQRINAAIPADSFITLDEGWGAAVRAGVFDDDVNGQLIVKAQKELVRQVLRDAKGEDNWPLFANMKQASDDGKPHNVYKREKFMDKNDYQQVVGYYKNYAFHGINMANGWAKRAAERYKQFVIPFPEFEGEI